MAQQYPREIGKLRGEKIDAAFIPLDPRQEEMFFWGDGPSLHMYKKGNSFIGRMKRADHKLSHLIISIRRNTYDIKSSLLSAAFLERDIL